MTDTKDWEDFDFSSFGPPDEDVPETDIPTESAVTDMGVDSFDFSSFGTEAPTPDIAGAVEDAPTPDIEEDTPLYKKIWGRMRYSEGELLEGVGSLLEEWAGADDAATEVRRWGESLKGYAKGEMSAKEFDDISKEVGKEFFQAIDKDQPEWDWKDPLNFENMERGEAGFETAAWLAVDTLVPTAVSMLAAKPVATVGMMGLNSMKGVKKLQGLSKVGKMAKAAGGADDAILAGRKADRILSLLEKGVAGTSYGGSEGLVGAGMAGKGWDEEWENKYGTMPIEDFLLKNTFAQEIYSASIEEGMSPTEAADHTFETAKEQGRADVMRNTMITTSLGGAPAGMMMSSLIIRTPFSKAFAKGRLRAVVKGAVAEGLVEEGPQSAFEQYWMNVATQKYADNTVKESEGVFSAAIKGVVGGATLGGPLGGVMTVSKKEADKIEDRKKNGEDNMKIEAHARLAASSLMENFEADKGKAVGLISPILQRFAQTGDIVEAVADLRHLEKTGRTRERGLDNVQQEALPEYGDLDVNVEHETGEARGEQEAIPYPSGSINGTINADGMNTDIIGPATGERIFIAEKNGPDGKFEQYKVLYGFENEAQAREGFEGTWGKGKLGNISQVTHEELVSQLEIWNETYKDLGRPSDEPLTETEDVVARKDEDLQAGIDDIQGQLDAVELEKGGYPVEAEDLLNRRKLLQQEKDRRVEAGEWAYFEVVPAWKEIRDQVVNERLLTAADKKRIQKHAKRLFEVGKSPKDIAEILNEKYGLSIKVSGAETAKTKAAEQSKPPEDGKPPPAAGATPVTEAEIGSTATVYNIKGEAVEAEVIERSDLGSVRVRMEDGREVIVDAGAGKEGDLSLPVYSENASSPDFTVKTGKHRGRSVSELSDAELKMRLASRQAYINKNKAAMNVMAVQDAVREANALRNEQKRREVTAPLSLREEADESTIAPTGEESDEKEKKHIRRPIYREINERGFRGARSRNGGVVLTHFARSVHTETDPSKAGQGADRHKRSWKPKVTYFGLETDEHPYQRESLLGTEKHTAEVDLLDLYPADTNPDDLWIYGDYEQSIENMKAAGFKGYWSDNPSLGKVAVVWDVLPLTHMEAVAEDPGVVRERERNEAALKRLREQTALFSLAPEPFELTGTPDPTFSDEPFFSALLETVEKAEGMPKKGAALIKRWLDGQQKKGAFKQEERDWMGLDEFLDNPDAYYQGTPDFGDVFKMGQPVTRQAVQKFVRAHQVKIVEITYGLPETGPQKEQAKAEAHYQAYVDTLVERYNIDEMAVHSFAAGSGSSHIADNLSGLARFAYEDYAAKILEQVEAVKGKTDWRTGLSASSVKALAMGNDPNGIRRKWLLDAGITPSQISRLRDLHAYMVEERNEDRAKIRELRLRYDATKGRGPQSGNPDPKFTEWTLDRGENEREMLLTVPDVGKGPAGHYNEPGVMVHIRFNDRTDVDGKRILFIEEVQSDLHQRGRKRGYRGAERKIIELRRRLFNIVEANDDLAYNTTREGTAAVYSDARALTIGTGKNVTMPEMHVGDDYLFTYQLNSVEDAVRARDILDEFLKLERQNIEGVPDAPFKKAWPLLAMKRMIRYAAENGYDRIGWTTGEQQNKRYELSEHFTEITYNPQAGVLEGYDFDGGNPITEYVHEDELDEYISEELANEVRGRIQELRDSWDIIEDTNEDGDDAFVLIDVNGEAHSEDYAGSPLYFETEEEASDYIEETLMDQEIHLEGLDLHTKGGEGMIGFYDKSLPRMVNKFVKKWGGRTTETAIEVEEEFEVWGSQTRGLAKGEAPADKNLEEITLEEAERLDGAYVLWDAGGQPRSTPDRVKKFYDKFMVGDPASRSDGPGKPAVDLGWNVHTISVQSGPISRHWGGEGYRYFLATEEPTISGGEGVWALDITPEMTEASMGGFAMFSLKDESPAAQRQAREHAKQLYDRKDWTRINKGVDASAAGAMTPDEIQEAITEWTLKGVASKYFKRWFGKSKTVDGWGQPIVFYHGSPSSEIEDFRARRGSRNRRFTSLSTDAAFANSFAHHIDTESGAYQMDEEYYENTGLASTVYPNYVRSEKLFDFRDKKMRRSFIRWVRDNAKNKGRFAYEDYAAKILEQVEAAKGKTDWRTGLSASSVKALAMGNDPNGIRRKWLLDAGITPSQISRLRDLHAYMVEERNEDRAGSQQSEQAFERDMSMYSDRLKGGDWSFMEGNLLQKFMAERSYDAFYMIEGGALNIGVFDPRSIKSATGNAGTFSNETADILFSLDESLDSRRADKGLKAFRKGFYEKLNKRVATARETLRAAVQDGIFDGYTVGDRLQGKTGPITIEGYDLQEYKAGASKLANKAMERLGIEPTIVKSGGNSFIPMLWYSTPDGSKGRLYLDAVREMKIFKGPQDIDADSQTMPDAAFALDSEVVGNEISRRLNLYQLAAHLERATTAQSGPKAIQAHIKDGVQRGLYSQQAVDALLGKDIKGRAQAIRNVMKKVRGKEIRKRTALSVPVVKQEVARIVSGLANPPPYVVHQDYTTLPARIRRQVEAGNYQFRVEGMLDPQDPKATVHIVAGNIGSMETLHRVFTEETMGHHGLRGFFGESLDGFLLDVLPSVEGSPAWEALRKSYHHIDLALNSNDPRVVARAKLVATEELIAKQDVSQKVWDKFVAWFRQQLRNMGLITNYTENDIRRVMGQVHSRIIRGTTPHAWGVRNFLPAKYGAAPYSAAYSLTPYVEEYPPVAEPTDEIDANTGEPYKGKGTSPTSEAFKAARSDIMKTMEKEGFDPYFDPADRYDVDSAEYPIEGETITEAMPMREATKDAWRKKIHTQAARNRLQKAYDVGSKEGFNTMWYAMGQLEYEFVNEYGEEEGRRLFRERFVDAMAATTAGNKPQANFIAAMFANYQRMHGNPLPTAAWQAPTPVGGHRFAQNMAAFEKYVMGETELLPKGQPKMFDFGANFMGYDQPATVDVQMARLIVPGRDAPEPGRYGIYEELIREMAEKNGISPREFQEVAWGGVKFMTEGYIGTPMIQIVNQSIERTHQLTGMEREEIVQRGILRGETPMYALRQPEGREDELSIVNERIAPAHSDKTVLDRVSTWLHELRASIAAGDFYWGLKQGLLDDAAVIERYERELFGEVLDASISPYKSMHTTKNLSSVMAAIAKVGIPAMRDGVFQPVDGRKGFIEIFRPLYEHPDGDLMRLWEGYAAARRARELIGQTNKDGTSREKWFTPEEIEKLTALDQDYPIFDRVFQDWKKFNTQLLDLAVEQGVLSEAERDAWADNDYVPFYRAMEEFEGVDQKTGRGMVRAGVANQESGIKRLHGAEMRIANLTENMWFNTASLIDKVYKNHAMNRVVQMLEGTAMNEVEMPWEAIRITNQQLAAALERSGLLVGEPTNRANMSEAQYKEWRRKFGREEVLAQVRRMTPEQKMYWNKVFRRVRPTASNVVGVMREGKLVYYEIEDEMLLSTLQGMGAEGMHGLMKAMGMAKSILTKMVTLDPAFMLANWTRDTVSAWVTSDANFIPVLDSVRAMGDVFKEKGSYINMMMSGAGGGGFYDMTGGKVSTAIKKELTHGSKHWGRSAWIGYKKLGAASENSNRLAISNKILAKGGTMAEAMYQAQDIMNFTMSGDYQAVKFLIRVVPFLNARMQGMYRLARGARDHPIGFAAKGFALMAATMALLGRNWDDDDYERLEGWQKDMNYNWFVDGFHYAIPKPFEVGLLFSTLPERLARSLLGRDDLEVSRESLARGLGETLAFNPIPQLFKPMVEQFANYNMFLGRDIENMSMQGLEPKYRATPWTSPAAQRVGRMMPDWSGPLQSPVRIEHIVRAYTGTMGLYTMNGMDFLIRQVDPNVPPRAARRWYEKPVLSRFIKGDAKTARYNKYTQKIYDVIDESNKAQTSVNMLMRQGAVNPAKVDEALELAAERGPLVDVRPDKVKRAARRGKAPLSPRQRLYDVKTALSKLNAQQRAVELHSTMDPEEKRKLMDEMQVQRHEILARAAEMLEKMDEMEMPEA